MTHRCVFPEPDGWLKIVPDEYWPWFDPKHPMNAAAPVPTMEDFNRMSRQLWENDKIRGTVQSSPGVAALFGKKPDPRMNRYQQECVWGVHCFNPQCTEKMECQMRMQDVQAVMWRPIYSAPKDGTEILLFGPCSSDAGVYAPDRNVGWWETDFWATRDPRVSCEPTHWMPLPEPPK